MDKKIFVSAALSGLFAIGSAYGEGKGISVPSSKTTAHPAAKAVAKGECHGVTSCHGKGECKSDKNECKGKNTCKGQGWMSMNKKACDKKKGEWKPKA